MTPSQQIAKLDRWIAIRGEDVQLRRTTGTIPNQTVATLPLKAWVRPVKTSELVGSVKDTDLKVILSPTGMTWDAIRDTDSIEVAGKIRSVVSALPLRIGGVVCRYDLHVSG